MTEKKKELTPSQQYHAALHAMPSAIGFNAKVGYGKVTFEYVDFKALRDAVLPILEAHDLAVRYITDVLNDIVYLVGIIAHKDGEDVGTFRLPLRTSGKPQDLGSEITYFKRYALAALCGVVSDKDDDGNFADKAEAAREVQEKKKENLKGPLQRTALRAQLRLYLTGVLKSTSMEEFKQQAIDYKPAIDQATEQWSEFFDEQNEEGFPTFREQIKKKKDAIKREEAIEKQQREDMEPPQ